MERISRLVGDYWPGCRARRLEAEKRKELEEEQQRKIAGQCQCAFVLAAKKCYAAVESVLQTQHNCASSLIVFNILFWGFMALEVRGILAASSAALALAIAYAHLENSDELELSARLSQSVAQLEQFLKNIKWRWDYERERYRQRPGEYCFTVVFVILGMCFVMYTLGNVLFAYILCMTLLIGPALHSQFFSSAPTSREWDNEMEEFLPAVTEDSLQVLKRAGETGERSPTPPTSNSDPPPADNFEEDLVGLRMPAHDEASTDGLELSELELSSEIDAIRFQTGHFQRANSSSSEDEVDLRINPNKLAEIVDDEDSEDSEFEIIDSRELANLKNV